MSITFLKKTDEYSAFIKELFFYHKTHELNACNFQPEMLVSLLEMQFRAQEMAYQQQFPEAEGFVLATGQRPVGWLLINKAETYHIVNIIVHHDFRGQGIGAAAINEIIEQARNSNLSVTVNVDKNNPALKLYSRLGFRVAGKDEVYVTMST